MGVYTSSEDAGHSIAAVTIQALFQCWNINTIHLTLDIKDWTEISLTGNKTEKTYGKNLEVNGAKCGTKNKFSTNVFLDNVITCFFME